MRESIPNEVGPTRCRVTKTGGGGGGGGGFYLGSQEEEVQESHEITLRASPRHFKGKICGALTVIDHTKAVECCSILLLAPCISLYTAYTRLIS